MRARVFNRNPLVGVVIAVDQQQEVDRSPYIEGLLAFDPHRMKIVAKWPTPRLVLFNEGKA